MHRHGYKGRKFGRKRDDRRAMLKALQISLINEGSITTTLYKAKEIVPKVEKLITRAKKADLHSRRIIIAKLSSESTAHRLVDDIAPKLTARSSGHLRLVRSGFRRGDNSELATISFVDDIEIDSAKKSDTKTVPAKAEAEDKKPKTSAKKAKTVTKVTTEKEAKKKTATAKKPATKRKTPAKETKK